MMRLPDITRAARNPKRHADTDIIASLRRFGLAELVLIDERTGLLVAGEGRINALHTLHQQSPHDPPAGVVPGDDGVWLVPVQRGWASANDREAAAYLIASNRLSALGGWDEQDLAVMLRELDSALEGTGYDPADLAALAADATAAAQLDQLAASSPFTPPDSDVSDDVSHDPPPDTRIRPRIRDPFRPEDGQHDHDEHGGGDTAPPWEPTPVADPGGTEPQWFQISWSATHEQRNIIHEAIRAARNSGDKALPSVAALTEVCRHYLDCQPGGGAPRV